MSMALARFDNTYEHISILIENHTKAPTVLLNERAFKRNER